MPKFKVPRKSTNIDMTAMCDVAFLLLTFFMLATKFKPEEAVEIKIPSSVSAKAIPTKDFCTVSIDKEGKVYLQLDNPISKQEVIAEINETRGLGLTSDEINKFVNFPSVGVPFSQLKGITQLEMSEFASFKQGGIPVDSANNELSLWVRYIVNAFVGKKLKILIKGDNLAKFKDFQNVLKAFKENNILKFDLITTPEDAPVGTDLYVTRQKQLKEGKAPTNGVAGE